MPIPRTYNEFLANEADELGEDFVEAQFILGYEPTFLEGLWQWVKANEVSVLARGTTSATVPNSTVNMGSMF